MRRPKKRVTQKLKRARVPGFCWTCQQKYRAGTVLAPDGQGRWVHKTCSKGGHPSATSPVVTTPYGKCTCGGWLYADRVHACKGVSA